MIDGLEEAHNESAGEAIAAGEAMIIKDMENDHLNSRFDESTFPELFDTTSGGLLTVLRLAIGEENLRQWAPVGCSTRR